MNLHQSWVPQPVNVPKCDGFKFPLATLWIVLHERNDRQRARLLGMFRSVVEQRSAFHGIPEPW